MSAVLDVIVSVSKDGTVEIDKVKRSADQAENSTKKLTKSTDRLSAQYVKTAKNIAIAVAGLYAVKKSVDLITGSVKSFTQTSAQFESFETTLKSITGSSEKAKESMSWIQDFTATTPFQLAQVTEGFVKMKAYGLEPTDGTLKTLGDTASAMGKDVVQAVEAMADAVTGENERLKEFGIKASKDGDTIAYAWADSSGKARNIVIDNNKDVIQSTLNAIFNEKYVGAMDEQSKTWDGMMSNLSDRWTLFKKSIMDEGLFTYFKAILGVVGDLLGDGFNDAKSGAREFSDDVISGIESIILGVGNMYDMFSGVKLVFKSLGIFFDGFVIGVVDGINTVDRYFFDMSERMREGFGSIGRDFTRTMNDIKSFTGIGTIEIIEPFKADIYTPLISGQKELEKELEKNKKIAGDLVASLINEDGKNGALKIIDNIKKKVSELTATEAKGNKAKEDAKKLLDKMGAGYGDLEKDTKKANKAQDKALKEAQKATRVLGDEMQSIGDDFASTISGAFGTLGDEIYRFYTEVSDLMAKASAESIAQSQAEGAGATGPAIAKAGSQAGLYGAIAMAGLLAVFGMASGGTFDSEEVAPELGDNAKASDTLVNALDSILDVQYPMLEVSREMAGYLLTISKAFGGIENSLIRSGIDLGGDLFQDTFKKGTLFGGKSTSLYGTSIEIESATMADLIDGEITAMLDTVTKTVSKKWYGSKKTYYNHKYTDISSDIGDYIAEATTAIFDSLSLSGDALGIDTSSLMDETISLGKMDTTGMSAEEVSAEIQGRFSAQVDAISEKYFGVVKEFQKSGEELGETLFRVVANFDQVSHSLGLIDKSVDWRTANIITEVAGGLDKLGASMSTYTENFFTEEEQYTMKLATMSANFSSLGVAMPTSNKEFRSLIEGIGTTTDAGATLFAELISLSGAFSEMTDASDALGESTRGYIDDISSFLAGQYSFLTTQGKTDYANMMLEQSKGENPLLSTVEASQMRLESAYNSATTKEEFDLVSRQHLEVLVDNAENDATNSDLLEELVLMREKLTELEEITREKA